MRSFEKKTGKTWNFNIFPCLVVKFCFDTKNLSIEFFLSSKKFFFLLKSILKVALQYLFNVFMLFNLKLLKIDQKLSISGLPHTQGNSGNFHFEESFRESQEVLINFLNSGKF